MTGTKKNIISRLQKDILQWEGYWPPPVGTRELMSVGPLETAFPNNIFPISAAHEMICRNTEQAVACGGFVIGMKIYPGRTELIAG